MKKFLIRAMFLCALLALVGCGAKHEAKLIKVDDATQIEQVKKADVAFLYFGKESCPYCQKFRPILEEKMKAAGTDVYYYDIEARAGDADFSQILGESEVVTVPKLVRFEKGKPVSFVDHLSSEEEIAKILEP